MRDVGTVQRRLRNDAPGAEGGETSPAPCHASQHRNGCRPIQPVITCFHLFSPSFTCFHLISLPGLGGGHAANPISPQRDHNSPKVFYRRFPITRIRNSAFCILHSAFSYPCYRCNPWFNSFRCGSAVLCLLRSLAFLCGHQRPCFAIFAHFRGNSIQAPFHEPFTRQAGPFPTKVNQA